MNPEIYSHYEENLRVLDAGKSQYRIVRDGVTGFWSIETSAGSLPAPLREKSYTSHRLAYFDIKNYLDGHAERSILYAGDRKKKTEKTEEVA